MAWIVYIHNHRKRIADERDVEFYQKMARKFPELYQVKHIPDKKQPGKAVYKSYSTGETYVSVIAIFLIFLAILAILASLVMK